MSSNNIYYTYILVDPRTNLPFYVGKGKGRRPAAHFSTRSLKKISYKNHKIKKIQSLGLTVIISYYVVDVSEDTAFICEKALIKKYGRIDNETGILTNLTDGGEGVGGIIPYTRTDAHRKKPPMAQETKNKISKKIRIFNRMSDLMYETVGNFAIFCKDLDLPYAELMLSYRNNGHRIYQKKRPVKESWIKFIGWYARISED